MRRLQACLSFLCSYFLVAGLLPAQQTAIRIDPPQRGLGWLTRPYQKSEIPPINLANSSRLESLVRAGNLYLSAKDVIALALENNLDIEIQRYGPLLTKQVSLRARGGGQLRDVSVAVVQGPTSISTTGVSATGTGPTAAAGANVSSSGQLITQLGPTIPSFDPQLSFFGQWGHATSPNSNTVLTGTTALIQDSRIYQAQYSQSTDFGLTGQLSYTSSHNHFNSSFYDVNPYNSGNLSLSLSQNLLYGFGVAVLGRNIRVAKNNEKVSMLQFQQQIITTVSSVLNLYWDLVSFNQDLKARKDELATAQALFDDNKKQVQIGTLAPIEVTRAEAQVYTSQQDLLISQTNLLQQEIVLKNALSRNGVASPLLAEVHVVPLDTIQVPEKDELKPVPELVAQALKNRLEIAQDHLTVDSNKINLVAIKNELKPTLQVFTTLTNSGLSGQDVNGQADPFVLGGYGNLLGQIFRRNYPSYSAGLSLNIPLRNRQAQADYATSVLQLRQQELTLQKQYNQVRVDVQNAVIGVRQARVRYDSAVKARILQQQTLDADKKKYTLGASTVYQVVLDQQTLSTADSAETQALANYSHARIAFDQSLGTTLDANHISVDEALTGHVAQASVLPANLPKSATEEKQ